ncbi:exo-beta-1,3-glucanase [Magnetospirillum sp. UT-4]|uniref:glycoside hydrolase family 17 protein n=1 Tax=Magnetospirillum sp. UT-4 TaxID=2681467 RepID=UPI001386348E|nr:exo-beta-1,3-glucanase [Magnetospirillum sp. UT-4]CAA7617760.1 Beta (1-6) glucans synthase [Magnetospirillum sp. UT-4]
MTLRTAVLAVIAAALFSLFGWWLGNRPVPVELSFDEPFPSVSFAPFRRGQSPITGDYPPPAQIEEDLKSLVGVTRGIRTYTSREGLDVVPDLARKFGIEVTHSAWLGKKTDINAAEVKALIEAANAHPDVIKRVIVGNEVLLRQDLGPDQLIAYIRQVKAAVKQPVSYADVWAFYLRYPQVADEVDFITIHILPYWEDEPVGVEGAAQHIVKIYRMMQEKFPGKPILIGEAGWPTRGRGRGPAAVNMENAAFFVRTLAKVSKENGFDYNVVEAFDQPWKAKLEGTVGAFWGVVDSDRQVKFRMSGPVEANPGWLRQALISVVLGAAGALLFLRKAADYTPGRAMVIAALAQVLAAAVVWQAMNALWIAYSTLQDIWALARIALHAAFAALILRAAGLSLRSGASPVPSRWGERLTIIYAVCAWAVTLLLFFNGRYRDIPNLEFLVPALGLFLWGVIRYAALGLDWKRAFAVGHLFAGSVPAQLGPAKEMTIALLVSAALAPLSESLALYLGEDFQAMHPDLSQQIPMMAEIAVANGEMLVWAGMLLVMALPFLAEWRLARARCD